MNLGVEAATSFEHEKSFHAYADVNVESVEFAGSAVDSNTSIQPRHCEKSEFSANWNPRIRLMDFILCER